MASASSNKSKPLDWSKRARADLDRIYDYYLDAAPYDVAEKAVREVLQQGKRIAEQAMVYRAGPKGTRECVMRRFPFILIYRIEPNKVRIVRVLHQAREYFNR